VDIYCGNCGHDIGLQTNEEYNKLKAENEKLRKALRNIESIARPEYEKFLISKWGLIISEIARLELVENIEFNRRVKK
jgi:hypothetical protein